MPWSINLRAKTATNERGQVVRFRRAMGRTIFDSHCFNDPDGRAWQGYADAATCGAVGDSLARSHLVIAAVDAYSRALRDALDPFPPDI